MHEIINEQVDVTSKFDSKTGLTVPVEIVWKSNKYPITKVGLHHTFKEGDVLIHVFSVVSGNLFFQLHLNSKHLDWTLKEISDGHAD